MSPLGLQDSWAIISWNVKLKKAETCSFWLCWVHSPVWEPAVTVLMYFVLQNWLVHLLNCVTVLFRSMPGTESFATDNKFNLNIPWFFPGILWVTWSVHLIYRPFQPQPIHWGQHKNDKFMEKKMMGRGSRSKNIISCSRACSGIHLNGECLSFFLSIFACFLVFHFLGLIKQ